MKKILIIDNHNSLECHIREVSQMLPSFGDVRIVASFDVTSLYMALD